MNVADELDALLSAHDACEVVVFADISAKMTLLCRSAETMPQETLDSLCHEAALLFEGAASKLCSGGAPSKAIVSDDNSLKVFLLAEPGAPDALCCICDPAINMSAFVQDAQSRLGRITAETGV